MMLFFRFVYLAMQVLYPSVLRPEFRWSSRRRVIASSGVLAAILAIFLMAGYIERPPRPEPVSAFDAADRAAREHWDSRLWADDTQSVLWGPGALGSAIGIVVNEPSTHVLTDGAWKEYRGHGISGIRWVPNGSVDK